MPMTVEEILARAKEAGAADLTRQVRVRSKLNPMTDAVYFFYSIL